MTSARERMIAPKDLYRRWLDELWAGQPIAHELVSEDFVGHWPDRDVHGPDELTAMVDKTRSMLTDLRFVVEVQPFVEGDMLAARWIGTGAAPDGPKRFTGNDMFKVADGRFVEYWTGTSEG
ncbi:ester cyclase [Mycolicibacterium rhodesiae]|jgi:hypothetical protein|nr:nuclear transport factor 2 family protein [Mycolicibacterium rhodesiae]